MYNKRSYSSDNAFYNRNNESTYSDDSYFARTDNFRRWHTPSQSQTSYVFDPYSSPYVNGKKNNSFFNPSLSSNDVFYDHNYGYVNDFPNERLLSPVKNDRFGESIRRKKESVDHQAPPSRWKRETDDEIRPSSRQNYFLSRDYIAEPESQRRRAQLRSADGLPLTRQELSNSRILIQQEGGNDEKTPVSVQRNRTTNSFRARDRESFVQPDNEKTPASVQRNVRTHSVREGDSFIQPNHEKTPVSIQRNMRTNSVREGDSFIQPNHEKTPVSVQRNMRTNSVRERDSFMQPNHEKTPVSVQRDVRTNSVREKESFAQPRFEEQSEASSVPGSYVCTNCLNHHLCVQAKAKCAYEKQRDRLEELNVLSMSKQKQEKEDLVKRLIKAKKVAETRQLGEKIEQSYQEKLENRRSPPRTANETEFKGIFDAHDHRSHMRRVMSASFSNYLLDQMDDNQAARRSQKLADSQFYNTSLQVKGINYNKYLDDPETVLSVLKSQVKQKASQKKFEKERDVQMEQELLQRNFELQQEEYYRQQEEKYQRNQELQESLHKLARDKKSKQYEEKARKAAERFHVDKGYARHKKILEEQKQIKRAHAFDLQQEMKRQQVDNSYKKRYEERKLQKTKTSFDPKPRVKNLLPCGDCNNLYEKAYMTKFYN